jgi:hypothetical protein
MTCTLCALFILWRRANSLRGLVSHQLKTWTRSEGRIRLSEDDGPPAAEFLGNGDDDDDESEELEDNEDDQPLAQRMEKVRQATAGQTATETVQDGLPSHT